MKNEYLVALNFPKFYVPKLNEEIIKNKNIHHYHRRNDKRQFDLQNVVSKAAVAVVDFANLCLESNKKNEVIYSEDIFAKVTITLIGKMNYYIASEGKEKD